MHSVGFLVMRGIHSWAMMSGKMHEDEIKRFRVNFQSASRLFESRKAFSNSFFFYFLYVCSICLWKYSSRSRSKWLWWWILRKTRDLHVFGHYICWFANKWRCKDIGQILLHGDFSCFFSVHSVGVMCQAKILLFEVTCWL